MKHILMTMLALVLATGAVNAQENSPMRNNWRIGYAVMSHNQEGILYDSDQGRPFYDDQRTKSSLNVEWGYNVNSWLELGLYSGLKDGSRRVPDIAVNVLGDTINDTGLGSHSIKALQYGITARVHVLPLASVNSRHWDVYVAGRMGGWCARGNHTEYGLGAGINWFPTKHFGLYAESEWGSFQFSQFGYLMSSGIYVHGGLIIRH